MSASSPLWSRRVVVVAGKGGVGRTTLATAAVRAAAAAGRRAVLVEVHGARAIGGLWGVELVAGEPRAVAPGLDLLRLDAAACLGAYVADRSAIAPLASALLRARVMRAFLDAIPGMADLLHLGLLNSLLDRGLRGHRPYDVVVVDAPPTGHGVAFTGTARAMAEMTREGPVHDEACDIARRFEDPAVTAQVVVTLPEALPVAETRELLDALGPQRPTVAAVVANRVLADPFDAAMPWEPMRAALASSAPGWVALGDRLEARLQAQRDALHQLRELAGDTPLVTTPELEAPVTLAALAALEAALEDL